jgi:phage baseplate assembly protein V
MPDWDNDMLVFPRDKTGRDSEIRNSNIKGKVIDRKKDETGVFVRVQLLDREGLITQWLPVMQPMASTSRKCIVPKIGADVNVNMFTDGDGSDGCVNGSFYNTGNPPPDGDIDADIAEYPDGTVIEYDEISSTYRIDSVGPINLRTSSNVNINGVSITITASGAMIIQGATVTIEGPTTINGNLIVNGNIENTGDMMTDGIHLDHGRSMPHDA